MVDTYTARNNLIIPGANSYKNTWAAMFGTDFATPLDSALDGELALSMSGDVALTTAQARNRVVNITASGGSNRIITAPAVEKVYIVRNASTNRITFKTASGAGVVIPGSTRAVIFCDGLDFFRVSQSGYGLLESGLFGFSGGIFSLNIISGFTEFKLKILGFSLSGSGGIGAQFSADGVNYTTTQTIQTIGGGSETIYGEWEFDTLSETLAVRPVGANLTSVNTAGASSGATNFAIRLSGPLTHMRLIEVGTSYDGGTYELWAK